MDKRDKVHISNYQVITEREAADRLGCSLATLRRYRRDGRLPFIPGRPVTVLAVDVETLARALENTPKQPAMVDPALRARRAWFLYQWRQRVKK